MTEFGEYTGRYILKDLLIAAVKSPTLSIPDNPDFIELGTLAKECDRLMELTYRDPMYEEKGTALYVLPNCQMIIDTKINTSYAIPNGKETSIPAKITIKNPSLPKNLRQDKFAAGVIHTHGLADIPQSSHDLFPLFINTEFPTATPMSGVITPKRKIFIFRGENTPAWDLDFAEYKINSWDKAFEERVKKHLDWTMSISQRVDINRRAGSALVNQIARKYDLRIYTCESSETILKKGLL